MFNHMKRLQAWRGPLQQEKLEHTSLLGRRGRGVGGGEGGAHTKGRARGGGVHSTHLKCSQLAALQLAQPLGWPELLRASKKIQPGAQSKLDHVAYPVINAC